MHASFPSDKLIDGSLSQSSMETLLSSLGFRDWRAAHRHIQHIAAQSESVNQSLSRLLPYLLLTLSACADPDQALINLERFTDTPLAGEIFQQLELNPRTIEILISIFSGSQFLAEILLRNPEHLKLLTNRERLSHQKSIQEFIDEGTHATAQLPVSAQMDGLKRYQKGELLRIGAGDLLSLYDLPAVTSQLSNLADGLTQICLNFACLLSGIIPDGFVILGMGKLGGGELNYSSDIDLLFICQENGRDYIKLAQLLIDALSKMTSEGFLYRVDMRLRPWGRDGALVSNINNYMGYLLKNARLWEKQALLKARPIAGDLQLGEEFLRQVEPFIFGENPETLRTNVLAMKNRTEEILRSRGKEWGQVKLGEGSIRDVEFVVQYLQLAYGAANPKLRKKSTLQALRRLQKFQFLSTAEARVLTDGYIFQRTVEHFLQMMHYRQTYSLPSDPAAIQLLARRLGFTNRESFLSRYQEHSFAIRNVYSKFIGGFTNPLSDEINPLPFEKGMIMQHLSRMDSSYANSFSRSEIQHHAELADALSEKDLAKIELSKGETDGTWKVTVVAYDYLGELSLICGLLFVYGLDIQAGEIFTYETSEKSNLENNSSKRKSNQKIKGILRITDSVPVKLQRQKIVDVFTVQTLGTEPDWNNFITDLKILISMLNSGQRREARSELAKRVGAVFAEMNSAVRPLYPIEISTDNDRSERYTILHIQTADTTGFLYEFTNALSLTHTYISRMIIHTSGSRVDDLLYVTDEYGKKITDPKKLQELRSAAVLIKHFTHLLPRSPNPASALLHFREFLSRLFDRPNWTEELTSLENPQVMDNIARLLGVSDFLWDDFMRMQYANLFPVISATGDLGRQKNAADLQSELNKAINLVRKRPEIPQEKSAWRSILNDFKDREMFRIDMRHILGLTKEFWDFSEELTDLTEVVVKTAFTLLVEDYQMLHGVPCYENGDISPIVVLALGKCGGRELGFASDIELMFVYEAEGMTNGMEAIHNSAYFEKIVGSFLNAIHARQEGIFQVDLQLRPYGKAGSMAVSLDSFKKYYSPGGAAWAYERQALVKMRPIAGNMELGQKLCELRDEFTYNGLPFDVTSMRAMRERQVRHLVTAGKFNAKYSPGGLVDIEYLIQGLQITHGAADPSLRLANIRKAMAALHERGVIPDDDYAKLHKAHTFLRWLIDSMRVVRGNSKDVTVPTYGSEEFAFLARRLQYGNDVHRLNQQLSQVQADVVEINRRLLQ